MSATKTEAKAEPRTDTKKAKAVAIVKANKDKATKWLVSELMDQCKLSQLGARTYVYNIRKELGLEAPPRQQAAKKATTTPAKKKSDTKEKATAAPRKRSAKAKTEVKPAADEAQKASNADAINDE